MLDVLLLGPRGSGKTTVGRLVAHRLGIDFLDLDDLVQQAAGRTIREIFDREGEGGFRAHESAALVQAVIRPGVLATGGGIVTIDANRALLMALSCPRILLWASADVLYERIDADPVTAAQRPALTAHGGLEEVRRLLAARRAWYDAVATQAIDVSGKSIDAIAREIASRVEVP